MRRLWKTHGGQYTNSETKCWTDYLYMTRVLIGATLDADPWDWEADSIAHFGRREEERAVLRGGWCDGILENEWMDII